MTVYKLMTNSVADADGVASIDIGNDGQIVGLLWAHRSTAAAGGISGGRIELSFSSSNGFASNDTRSSIATFCHGNMAGSIANGQTGMQQYVDLPGIPVSAGERMFLHNEVTNAPASQENYVYLYVEDKGASSRRVRL